MEDRDLEFGGGEMDETEQVPESAEVNDVPEPDESENLGSEPESSEAIVSSDESCSGMSEVVDALSELCDCVRLLIAARGAPDRGDSVIAQIDASLKKAKAIVEKCKAE